MKAWWERLKIRIAIGYGQLRQREGQLTMVLSVVIGALVGLVVVAFIALTGRIAHHFYPTGAADWRRILLPTLGALVSGWLLFRFFPDARGSGIPQTKAAFFLKDGYISTRTVIGKFLCCSLSLGSGISLGREGPSVQIGAGMASILARRLGLSPRVVQALVPVGAAAALAAAFNTPIAAVLFSLEEVVGDLHAPVLGGVVLSSATSWMVLHLLLGDNPLFHVAPYHMDHPTEFIGYAVLGVVGGLASVLFVKLLLGLRIWFQSWAARTAWAQPTIGGATVGLMAFFVPEVMGVGYPTVERVLAGEMILRVVVILAILKIIATAVAYASGNAGGIFGPALFIGAMCGAAVGHVLQMIAPGHTAGPGAFALVGMGTVFAGVVRTPMTSVIMIFELTRDYAIIVPLMLSNMIAFFISQKLQPEAVYEALAHQDGIHLPHGAPRAVPTRLQVLNVMQPLAAGVPPMSVAHMAAHVHPDQPLSTALERLAEAPEGVLPVTSRMDATHVIGTITLADALRAYRLKL